MYLTKLSQRHGNVEVIFRISILVRVGGGYFNLEDCVSATREIMLGQRKECGGTLVGFFCTKHATYK